MLGDSKETVPKWFTTVFCGRDDCSIRWAIFLVTESLLFFLRVVSSHFAIRCAFLGWALSAYGFRLLVEFGDLDIVECGCVPQGVVDHPFVPMAMGTCLMLVILIESHRMFGEYRARFVSKTPSGNPY